MVGGSVTKNLQVTDPSVLPSRDKRCTASLHSKRRFGYLTFSSEDGRTVWTASFKVLLSLLPDKPGTRGR